MRLDGYKEEWNNQSINAQELSFNTDHEANNEVLSTSSLGYRTKARLWAAASVEKAWVYVDVPYLPKTYFHPGELNDQSDQLRLSLVIQGQEKHFRIVSSSPGLAQVYAASNSPEHRIKAFWRESESSYQVEFTLPINWVKESFGIEVLTQGEALFSSFSENKSPSQISGTTGLSEQIKEQLQVFDLKGIQLFVTNNKGAYLADHGKFETPTPSSSPWLIRMFYDFALGKPNYPTLANAKKLGFYEGDEVRISLTGKPTVKQYQHNNRTVSSASTPIYCSSTNGSPTTLGALVTIQNTNSLTSFTDSAFSKLLMYSILLTLASALSLALYASWLSFRILQLQRSSNNAITDKGSITNSFKTSRVNDEIGDLSRSFGNLLLRLHEYTDYLKTLSDKLSHELRTPLAIVTSSLDNVERENISPEVKVYINRARTGSKRLSQILSAMAAANRVEQSISTSELQNLDLALFLPDLVSAYSDVYRKSKFNLMVEECTSPYIIHASEELFVQMLDKLIDNAVDFCDSDGSIYIYLSRVKNAANSIQLNVSNPGPHLPLEMSQQIFDSMVSIRQTSSKQSESREEEVHHLGLGLYISRLIANFHKGTLRAENMIKTDGATFDGVMMSVTLPASPTIKHKIAPS